MSSVEFSPALNHVKSVLKAFSIMEELDQAGELSIGEISERLSMDKATVHRLINTAKDAGYINQNLGNKKYANSFKLLDMGNRVMERTGVKNVARPFLENLWEATGETINLGISVNRKIIYIDKIESSLTIKVGQDIGTTVPIYCSGLGKAILAFTPEEEQINMLDNVILNKHTHNTIISKDKLIEALRMVRDAGYSIDDEEYVVGLICVSAPIFNYHKVPIAAISISCPKYRFDESSHLQQFTTLVKDAALKISRQMGYII